ncbi:uncharacterized protein LOC108669793 [Hyalella azteca]|uniref:Uncharacterized protein LOC108669793 n=1 Tax=Hyalella azteca TaxID=294128 RepID=A0A8B7NH14_HYAAZ|nr:uncharacterized protein LOC108669793 [Hyalella azteca]
MLLLELRQRSEMVKLSLLQECLCCLLVSFTLQIQALHAQDVVSQLKLFPNVTMIDATWELQEPTAEVSRYYVSWIPDGLSVPAASCYIDSPATSTSACDGYQTLDSCTFYNVTVQPMALDGSTEVDTGTPASAADYTLQDGERGEHSLLRFEPVVRKKSHMMLGFF